MTQEQPISILTALHGQSIILPDLNAILDGWPREVNQNLDRLRHDVDEWLGSAMSHSPKLETLKAADFGYFGATWWPRATYERLRIVTFLAAWLFVWDDVVVFPEIDMDNGSLWDNFELSNPYRNETREYVQYCLSLTSEPDIGPVKTVNATIQAFETIGTAIRKVYNFEQRKRFMNYMEDFLEMSQQEQMLRLRGTLPSLEEFWLYRPGSSAVHVTIALNEFAWDNKSLPTSVMEDGDMKLLWDYTNVIISTVNDIVSLKKEIARGSISSMIPLLYARSRDAQVAVDQTAEFLVVNVKAFEETAQRLLKQEKRHNVEEARELRAFIKGCQFYCSGNLTWR
ncbi:hypothetical protein HO133_007979 [Letharia lupina]|uniref:Terpene synthase n=1 Tax=Letharia lupina TaxID=560253 RepID=A0A8H6CRN2_9LECA|nr:uncharacterized protein HO133_007979 [Letharia lupina]KAF6228249.1 hypothetical protein HO133_007979 [Letharia lupina]